MNDIDAESGIFTFEVDAGLLFQLGERLVARSSIALGELIKNAYDADATQVEVLLEGVSKKNGSMIVEDNGSGMTLNDIRDHWMRIATDDKIRNPISPRFGRQRTGAKGIGRFAARRLADKLSLYSVAQRDDGTKERVTVHFQWKADFKPGDILTDIPISYEREIIHEDIPTGVTLLLEDVRDIWTETDVSALQRDLLSLVSPFPSDEAFEPDNRQGYEPDPGFSLKLEVPEFPEYEGELREHFLQAAWAVLEGRVDEQEIAHYHLDIRETGQSLDYTEKESEFNGLSGASFRIYYFVYRADYFKEFDFGAREAIRFGRKNAGVRIYLDGFRIYGYGEKGDDWLRLNELRAERIRRPEDITLPLSIAVQAQKGRDPFLLIPGNNQVFGSVLLSQSHHTNQNKEGIELNISRERLVENEAFNQLRHFLRIGIYWMTIQYSRVLYEQEISDRPKVDIGQMPLPMIAPDIDGALQDIERIVDGSETLSKHQKMNISEAVTEVRTVALTHDELSQRFKEEYISERSMLRVLASVGTMASFLNHQLRAIMDDLGAIAALFEVLSDMVEEQSREVFNDNIRALWRWHQFLKQQVGQLFFLLGYESRSIRQPYNLRSVISDVAGALEGYREEFGIHFTNEVPENLISPPMYLAEVHALLINIYTNALKAVRHQPIREIMVAGGYRDDQIYIKMYDTGKGLDIPAELAFEPFQTTSSPDLILGEGTGLGLYVVRSLLAVYGGNAQFVDAEPPWRTCIELVLPKR